MLYELLEINRSGFPKDVIERVNQLVRLNNRDIQIEFDTDRIDAGCAKVIETDDTILLHLPRPVNGTGTSKNPYIMGTNASAHDEWEPADDHWDITDPPEVDGETTDGVIFPYCPRVAQDTSNITTRTVALDGGGSVIITITPIYTFTRRLTFDSVGKLVYIGPENDDAPIIAQSSLVVFS